MPVPDQVQKISGTGRKEVGDKPKVLVLIRHYLPGDRHGGPVRSVSGFVDQLGDDILFDIVTLNHDATESTPYEGIRPGSWEDVGKARVMYLEPGTGALLEIWRLVRRDSYCVVYLNSFFDFAFSIFPMIVRRRGKQSLPVIIAPRGEFSPGALRLKHLKKSVFLGFSRLSRIYRRVIWQATTKTEIEAISATLGPLGKGRDRKVVLAENMAAKAKAAPADSGKEPDHAEAPLLVCFLSRITRKKNLSFALEILRSVNCQVQFRIIGNIEDNEYWTECERLIEELPSNVEVEYVGHVSHDEVAGFLRGQHLFLFPTLGENFGHVIYEALSCGVPVLTSDQTPWVDLESRGAGWTLPLSNTSAFTSKVQECAIWTGERRLKAAQAAIEIAEETSNDDTVRLRNLQMFYSACGRGRDQNSECEQ